MSLKAAWYTPATSAEGRTDLPSRPWPYFLSTSQEPTAPRRPCSNPTSCRHRCANLCIVVTADGSKSDINILVSIAYTVPLLAFKLRLARLGTRSRAVFETRRTRRQDCLENSFSGERLFNERPGLNRVRGVLFCAGFCRPENACGAALRQTAESGCPHAIHLATASRPSSEITMPSAAKRRKNVAQSASPW